jgi:hypothetical protein
MDCASIITINITTITVAIMSTIYPAPIFYMTQLHK